MQGADDARVRRELLCQAHFVRSCHPDPRRNGPRGGVEVDEQAEAAEKLGRRRTAPG
jgi:hypothetical protein